MAERFDPPTALVADVEERMEAWVEEIGIWAVFQVMTVVAQVVEMVARDEEVDAAIEADARLS